MSTAYAWEKFFDAISTLASSKNAIQERLGDAYTSGLIRLEPKDLPEEIQNDFRDLQEELTRINPSGDEGRVMATIETMGADRAAELARKIVSMYDRVTRQYARETNY